MFPSTVKGALVNNDPVENGGVSFDGKGDTLDGKGEFVVWRIRSHRTVVSFWYGKFVRTGQ